ncbi:MAG: hypothetical protein ACK5Q5_12460 [Planctomycetaceae bacterium]
MVRFRTRLAIIAGVSLLHWSAITIPAQAVQRPAENGQIVPAQQRGPSIPVFQQRPLRDRQGRKFSVWGFAWIDLHEVKREEFELWLLNGNQRDELQRQQELKMQNRLRQVDQLMKLSADQRDKLERAGRGDLERFWQAVDDAYQTVHTSEWTHENVPLLTKRLQLLSNQGRNDLHHSESLLAKTLKNLCRGDLTSLWPRVKYYFPPSSRTGEPLTIRVFAPPAPAAVPMNWPLP